MSAGTGNLKPFVKGDVRINRGGRRPGRRIADVLNAQLKKVITVKGTGEKIKLMDAICLRLAQLAASGNLRAMELIFERLEGKAVQPIELPPEADPDDPRERAARLKSLLARFDLATIIDAEAHENENTSGSGNTSKEGPT